MACRPRSLRSKPLPLCQFKGKYSSDSENAKVPEKPGGVTPTIVQGWPFTITLRPITDGSPPNLRSQVEYPSTDHLIDSPRRALVDSNHASQSRPDVEQPKIVARSPGDEDALGLTADRGKAEEPDTVTGDVLEDVRGATAIVLKIVERNAAEGSAGGLVACDHDEPVAIPYRQGSQDDGVHHAEHSGVDPDTQAERDNRREREARRSAQHPQAVPDVLQERVEEGASSALGNLACFWRCHCLSQSSRAPPSRCGYLAPIRNTAPTRKHAALGMLNPPPTLNFTEGARMNATCPSTLPSG